MGKQILNTANHEGNLSRDPNQHVSTILMIGLILAVVFMLIGIVLFIYNGSDTAATALQITAIPAALATGNPIAFLSLGLVILLATPAIRVVVLLVEYIARRQWLFAGIAFAVLAVLSLSFYLGVSH